MNKRGKDFLDFLTCTNLTLLNGCTIGDIFGEYTNVNYNGKSVVDYAATSHNIKPTPTNKIKYDKMNAFCKKHTDLGKKYFDEHRENSKKQWQIIRKNNSKSIKKLIDPNGTVTNTPSKIAENFNNFFANIAGNLKAL